MRDEGREEREVQIPTFHIVPVGARFVAGFSIGWGGRGRFFPHPSPLSPLPYSVFSNLIPFALLPWPPSPGSLLHLCQEQHLRRQLPSRAQLASVGHR